MSSLQERSRSMLRMWTLLAITLTLTPLLWAAVISCPSGDVACLITALETPGTTTIQLEAGTYTLTAVHHNTVGSTGLPDIVGAIDILGTGIEATIIARDPGAPPFRIFVVDTPGHLTLQHLTVRGGHLISDPGAGVLNFGRLDLWNTSVEGHTGEGSGMFGITLRNQLGRMMLVRSRVRQNTALTAGAILSGGALHITRSSIVRNVAEVTGGIQSVPVSDVPMEILESTIAGNTGGFEGGLFSASGGVPVLRNVTIAENVGPTGGLYASSPVSIENSLIAGNGDTDCGGALLSDGHNLIGQLTAECDVTLQPTDLTGEAGLSALVDSGAPGEPVVPLLWTSPAVNAGNPATCAARDQLRQPRVGACDVGAIEFSEVVAISQR